MGAAPFLLGVGPSLLPIRKACIAVIDSALCMTHTVRHVSLKMVAAMPSSRAAHAVMITAPGLLVRRPSEVPIRVSRMTVVHRASTPLAMLGTAIGRLLLIPGVSPIGVVAETVVRFREAGVAGPQPIDQKAQDGKKEQQEETTGSTTPSPIRHVHLLVIGPASCSNILHGGIVNVRTLPLSFVHPRRRLLDAGWVTLQADLIAPHTIHRAAAAATAAANHGATGTRPRASRRHRAGLDRRNSCVQLVRNFVDRPVIFLFVSGINDCCADIMSLTSGYVKGLHVVYKYLKVLPINQLLYELDRRTNERLVSR